jgi:hypothetical protein
MKKLFVMMFSLLFSVGIAHGQATSGNIVGVVHDSTGAVVAKASITVTNESTNVAIAAETSSSGEYHVSNLLPAAYDIKVVAPGFSTYVLKGVPVELNKSSTADAILSVSASSTIEVDSAAGVNLDTTTNNLTTTLSSAEITELPTTAGGFGALNASLLAPNVASPGGVGIGTGPSVGGQRPRNNNYTIEGIDVNDKSVTGPIIEVPSDATGQFTLITSQFSPEFGHSSGGQFDTTVISGTNKFHGKGYEYFENRNLNAINASQGAKVPNARFDFNRYGGQVGGPVLHDKLFFFGNYQRAEQGQSLQRLICTPTAAGLTTLSSLATSYGFNATNLAQYLKYVPAANYLGGAQVTRGPASNPGTDTKCNLETGAAPVPQTLAVFSGTTFSGAVPYASNTAVSGIYGSGNETDIPMGNYLIQAPVFANTDYITTSADYTLSNKDTFRFRYLYVSQGSEDTSATLGTFFAASPLKLHLLTFSEFHNFTPNLINEARIGYNRQATATPTGAFSYPGLDMFPNLTFYDMGGLNVGPDPNGPQSGIQNLYQFVDNVSYIKGKHSITMGFDGRKYISPQSFTQRVRGDYQWGYLTEFLHDLTPTDFGERSTGNFFYYGDQVALYGYANDTWRATPKLTVNFGLRYEFTSVPTGERAQALNTLASAPGLISFNAPQPAYKNFAPRFGFAYAPDEKTSIRAGFGMAYDVLFDNLGLLSFPPQYSATNDVNTGTNKKYGDPGFLGGGGLPAGTGRLNTYATQAAQRAATSAYLPDQVTPYAESWSLTVQRTLGKNLTAEIQYLGTRGIHLVQQNQINVQAKTTAANQLQTYLTGPTVAANGKTATINTSANANNLAAITALSKIQPAFAAAGFTSNITSYQPFAQSNYNGLGLNLTRRFQNGLQFNTSYTWSKTMDDATAEVNASALSQRRPQDPRNVAGDYSRSGLDHTHRLTVELIYDVPYFKHSNFLLRNVVGNWLVAPIYTYESPEYVTVTSAVNSNLDGDTSTISRTIANPTGNKAQGSPIIPVYSPTLYANCPVATPQCPNSEVGYLATNPGAYYITAGAGTLPNVGRNTLAGRPVDNIDLNATKKFTIKERYGFEFQALAFNVLNHAQYVPGNISSIGGSNTSGAATAYLTSSSPGFNQVGSEWTAHARSMELVGKFTF